MITDLERIARHIPIDPEPARPRGRRCGWRFGLDRMGTCHSPSLRAARIWFRPAGPASASSLSPWRRIAGNERGRRPSC